MLQTTDGVGLDLSLVVILNLGFSSSSSPSAFFFLVTNVRGSSLYSGNLAIVLL